MKRRGGYGLAMMRGIAVGTGGVMLLALHACIIAEPVTDLPTLPPFRPIIVRSSVVPPPSAVVGTFPDKFVIPVELVDPGVSFEWRIYIDYNPITGEGLELFGTSGPSGVPQRVRVLEVQTTSLKEKQDASRCHVVEFLVAQRFVGKFAGKAAHTPEEPPGGDAITWFYNPTGDLGGCPVADAGVVDAGAGARDADGSGS